MTRIEADRELCVSAGMCALTAPEIFDQDDDEGRVVVLDARPSADLREGALEAARLCPAAALTVHEEP
ncbi:ferredoxin [Streptoalloteichus hindustanus]|uniref:Ferredoxin n=1 Tax=Streptoalloteichus hindustanus TaxID=2017 RepID=A0A1M5MSP9_STRHI|nr:ferredoxin [Streptoalloteichus hindustanus]SHG80291.1 ferredoxin [Streptoalloteichus hindustanus]